MTRTFAPEDANSLYAYNPLYAPETCGLEIVVTVEADRAYEFDTILVVRDTATGDLYAGHDAGCSCPTPFEDFKGLGDFTQIRSEDDFTAFVRANGGNSTYTDWKAADVLDAARKVREALR